MPWKFYVYTDVSHTHTLPQQGRFWSEEQFNSGGPSRLVVSSQMCQNGSMRPVREVPGPVPAIDH